MSKLHKLQYISLCSKVLQELETHTGLRDKTLAEFIIDLGRQSQSDKEFKMKLDEFDADFTDQFTLSLFNIIKKMLPLEMQVVVKFAPPSMDKPTTTMEPDHLDYSQKLGKFPGLHLPNTPPKQKVDDPQAMHEPLEVSNEKVKKEKKEKKEEKEKNKAEKKERKRQKKEKKQKDKEQKENERMETREKFMNRERSRSHEQQYTQVEKSNIYEGTVTKVQDFGVFVQLSNFKGRKEGLVHISNIREKRVTNPFDVLKRNQKVWVKVISIVGDKIGLSMREVDQNNGQEIERKVRVNEYDQVLNQHPLMQQHQKGGNMYGSLTGVRLDKPDDLKVKKTKRISSPELWEMSRLKYNARLIDLQDEIEANKSDSDEVVSDSEDLEIDMNDIEPPFLRGQTTKAGVNLSPIRVVKNPEGTLQREALNAQQFARERREIREQQQRSQQEHLPRDLKVWEDPTEPGGLAGNSFNYQEQPEWKKEQLFKSSRTSRSHMSIKEWRESLPIYTFKDELLKAIRENRILIVIGETGSGKTTQITQYLLNAGYSRNGLKIGCTQPRRVAAMSVAKRVAEEMGVQLGEEVGYAIRFEDCTTPNTQIKYMTDGMLLREALIDKDMSQYSVIMLDEAHERTINTDVLFGLLKQVVAKRHDFTLIVTSATLDAEKFAQYFFNCKIFRIPGRNFPVEMFFTKEPESDYLEAALICCMQIHLDEPAGDILLFLTGQEEIDTACQILYERMKKLGQDAPELIILPVYSALPTEMQQKIFEQAPPGARKVVVATNIAEASITIDGIYYVVDPGFSKIKVYNPKLGMDSLVVAPISQASAKQRAGRAGRTGPGKCYRLYTEHAYNYEMLPTTVPEIQRTNLSNTILLLKAMGIHDLLNFDFMDPPPIQTMIAAMEQLYALGALDDEGLLTKVGRKMAEFPLEPPQAKMLLTAVDLGCVDEIITIIAMLAEPNIFYRPKDKQTIADQKKARFHQPEGDHLTLLCVYESWKKNNFSNVWCHENYIQSRSMRRAQDVRKQLLQIMERYKFPGTSCGKDYWKIRKAITAGYFFHVAKKVQQQQQYQYQQDPAEGYRTLADNHQVYIHPSSALFNKGPLWVVYHELVLTSKEYMREVCEIEPKWLLDVAPNYFKAHNLMGVLSKKKKAEKLEPLQCKFGDPNAWRLSKRKG